MAITSNDYAVHVELETDTGLPRDRVVNTWAMQALDGAAAFSDAADAFDAFYTAIASYLGATLVNGSGHRCKIYHLTDIEPRVPVYDEAMSLGGFGSTAMPAEVAICTSFAAAPESGVNPARRRGRVFLGPLATGVSDASSGYARVDSAVVIGIANATEQLLADLIAAQWWLCVWSRVDETLFPVTRGWVENDFDTQRRRQPAPTSRVTWP